MPEDASSEEKASAVESALREHRQKCQAGVERLLSERYAKYRAFWLSNSISLSGADKELVQAIAGDPEVSKISQEQVAYVMDGDENENKPCLTSSFWKSVLLSKIIYEHKSFF